MKPSIDTQGAPTYPCRPFVVSGRSDGHQSRLQADETYLSAQQFEARPQAWVSRPYGDQSRPPGIEASPCEGPRQAYAIASRAWRDSITLEQKMTFRFARHNRLEDAASFSRVFQKASRSADDWFTVLSRRNNLELARLGLAVSKKNCSRATGRNRIKRIVRESFRQHQSDLSGLDIVVMNKPPAASAANEQLFASLEAHWQRCERAGGN